MRHLTLVVVALIVAGCVSQLDPVQLPIIDYSSELANTTPLDGSRRIIMSGVYAVEDGKGRLGDTVAVRFDGLRFTIYAARNVTFVAGAGGARGDSAVFISTWRAVTGPDAGRLDLVVPASEGGKDLVDGKGNGKGLILRGVLQLGSGRENIRLRKLGQIKARLRKFQIIAHRGGGRNSERLGRSENSIPMMMIASALGATAIEIDVHMTKEHIPIVFHDPTFTARTVPSPYVIGAVENYTLLQMRLAARLVNGESIPTLREALKAVIDSTTLSMVWLDNKAPQVVDSVIIIQQEMLAYAASKGNDIRILFGIPDDEIFQRYSRSPLRGTVPVLCELDVQKVREVDAEVWAPRFTAGTQEELVKEMQNEGREVYVWTLDDDDFIIRFIKADIFDGILTNYPTLLAALFYTRQVQP